MQLFFILLLVVPFLIPQPAQAHSVGQPPYFKINGIFTDYYPVLSTSLYGFNLPQDIAPANYLVSENIEFEIDTSQLPVPMEIVEKSKFLWDYGDRTTTEGLKNSHAYAKPGTYVMSIKVDTGDGFEPEILQSTAINILPNADYKLPKAIIEINNASVNSPQEQLDVDFAKEVKFDGSKSDPGSSEITEYFWDLGNQESKTGDSFNYTYPENPYAVAPVLRIKTKDGFISDATIQIKDPKFYSQSKPKTIIDRAKENLSVVIVGTLTILVASALLVWQIKDFRGKKG